MVYDKMLASALREAEEQARLLGASAERELALRAEIERLRAAPHVPPQWNGLLTLEQETYINGIRHDAGQYLCNYSKCQPTVTSRSF